MERFDCLLQFECTPLSSYQTHVQFFMSGAFFTLQVHISTFISVLLAAKNPLKAVDIMANFRFSTIIRSMALGGRI